MTLRFSIGVDGSMKWLSHLDRSRALVRAMRRARWPLELTSGFHPHPRLTWGLPLPVGCAGDREPVDVRLDGDGLDGELLTRLAGKLPPGLAVALDSGRESPARPSIAALVNAAEYSIDFGVAKGVDGLEERLASRLAADEFVVVRQDGRRISAPCGPVRDTVRFRVVDGVGTLDAVLPAGQELHVRPEDFLVTVFSFGPSWVRVRRTAVLRRVQGAVDRL